MTYPPLLHLKSIEEYHQHYVNNYCRLQKFTFDDIRVYFSVSRFSHAFYTSSDRRNPMKDLFSQERAERMDWISVALQDKSADLYFGWDNYRKRLDYNRRVLVVQGNYVVIIQFKNSNKAIFITAYCADSDGLGKIQGNPKWQKNDR